MRAHVRLMRVVVVARPRDDPGDPTATPPVPGRTGPQLRRQSLHTATPPPFCEPEVLLEVDFDAATAGIQRAAWGGTADNACATTLSGMAGRRRAIWQRCRRAAQPRMGTPDGDGPAPAPAPTDWVSRTLNSDEWWAVVEVCTHFGGGTSTPGLFEGAMWAGGLEQFDATGSGAWRRRIAWGSHEALNDCTWCGAIGRRRRLAACEGCSSGSYGTATAAACSTAALSASC